MANDIRNILTISGNQKLIDEMLKSIQVDAFGIGEAVSARLSSLRQVWLIAGNQCRIRPLEIEDGYEKLGVPVHRDRL